MKERRHKRKKTRKNKEKRKKNKFSVFWIWLRYIGIQTASFGGACRRHLPRLPWRRSQKTPVKCRYPYTNLQGIRSHTTGILNSTAMTTSNVIQKVVLSEEGRNDMAMLWLRQILAARPSCQESPHGICGEHKDVKTGFYPSTPIFPSVAFHQCSTLICH